MENVNRSRARVLGVLALLAVACALVAWPARAWADGNVAKIGDTEYATLAAAVSAASDGDIITLIADTSVGSQIQISGKSITLDLNAYTLTLGSESNAARMLYVSSGASLTVTDSGDGGTITNDGYYSYGLIDVYGTLVIEDGTFYDSGSGDGASIKGRTYSSITINGGTFEVAYKNYGSGTDGSYVSNYYGNFVLNASSASVSITGGTYKVGQSCWGAIKLVSCSSTDSSADTVTVSGVTITTYDSVGIECSATDTTISGCTVTVQNSSPIAGSPATAIGVNSGSTVTVESGTYAGPYAVYVYNSGGTAIINGGTFSGTTAVLMADTDIVQTYDSAYSALEGSTIVVYDGNFSGAISIATDTSSSKKGDTSLTIYHGDFTSEDATDYVVSTYTNEDGETVYTVLTEETNEEDGTTYQLVHALVAVDAAEATCTEDGNVAYYVCSYEDCGSCFLYDEDSESYTEADYDSEIAIAATGHSYVLVESVDATCEEDGYATYTCSVCGNTYTETIAATGHDWGNTVEEWADDYSSVTVTWTCSVCGETYSETSTEIYSYTDDDGNTVYYSTLEGPVSTEGGWYFEEEAVADDATTDDTTETDSDSDDESELASTGDSTALAFGPIAAMGAIAVAAGLAARKRRNAA